jgi:hypothetical protein
LFRYREGVIHLDAEISDRALDLGVTVQELDGSQVTGAPVIGVALVRGSEWVPNSLASNPMLATHRETSRAYWRVVMPWRLRPLPVKRNSPGFFPLAGR